jgi:peptidoglycan hydrolase-like protein with peptidoglycan-binding domain
MVASPTQAVVALPHAVVVPPTQAIAMLQGPAAAAAKASAEAVPTPSNLPAAPVAAVPTAHPPFALRNDIEGNPIRWLQIRLADSGGYDGRIDGVVGPRTIEAYAAFRRVHGLPDSSDVDVAALALLEHPASAPPAIATPASAPSAIPTPTSATRIPHG